MIANRSRFSTALLLLGLVVSAVLIVFGGHALGSFPGRNGRIIFTVSKRNGSDIYSDIYSIRPDGSGKRRLTNDGHSVGGRFSADGRKIVYGVIADDASRTEWIMNADGSHPQAVPNTVNDNGAYGAFSPNGKQIIFAGFFRGPEGPQIFAVNLDGSDKHALAQGWGPAEFSPDGQTIAFERVENQRIGGIVLMDADGSHQRRLPGKAKNGVDPSFAPNGRRILFNDSSVNQNQANIYSINPDGSHLRQLTHNPHGSFRWDGGAHFSPDGKRIVFGRRRRSRSGVYVMHPDGSHVHRLRKAVAGAGDWQPLP